MSHPTDRLRALFSGVPKVRRDKRPIMALQAYIDDSKQGEDVLVLAGYIAPWEQWEQFSIEWDALLKGDPPWPEFKMRHAIRHLARAEKFYRLVEKYALAYVVCVVEIEPLRRLCSELQLHSFMRNPYIYAFKAIMGATYQELERVNLNEPLEFIFDERGERRYVRSAWEYFELGVSESVRRRIACEPKFERSVDVLPLQAAEIIAWHAREHWLKHRKFEGDIDLSWTPMRPVLGHIVYWDYDALKPNLESLRELLIGMGVMQRPQFPIQSIDVTFSYDPGSESELEQQP